MSKNKIPEKYENILGDLGWYYSYSYSSTHNGEIDVEQHSPAGEDFFFTVSIDNFVEEVIDYAETFDPEEHAAQWINTKYTGSMRGIPGVAILIEDAFEIQNMLKELADALQEKPQENFEEYETPILCGFVWKHGNKDFSAWEVQLKDEDRDAIESILEKYDTCGSSLRNCYDSLFSEVYS